MLARTLLRNRVAASVRQGSSLSRAASQHKSRSFFSASKLVRGDAVPQLPSKEEEKKQEKGIVAEYGWYPFLGLGAVAVLSKEVIVMDVDFAYTMTWGLTVGILWFAVGGDLYDDVQSWVKENRGEVDSCNELYIDTLKEVSKNLKTAEIRAGFTEDLVHHIRASSEAMVVYENRKLRHNAYAAVMEQLKQAKAAHDQEEANLRDVILNSMEPYVLDAFDEDPALVEQDFRGGIMTLKEEPEPKDPLREVLAKYLEEEGWQLYSGDQEEDDDAEEEEEDDAEEEQQVARV